MAKLEFDTQLVEEAVFLVASQRLKTDEAEADWQREREDLYQAPPGANRDRAFRELAAAWFERMDLRRPIAASLERCPQVMEGISTIHVRRAVRARDEGSEIFARAGARLPEHMVLAFEAQRFLDPALLEQFVLRELFHAEDILDPAFGFDPIFDPDPGTGHARRELLRDRFQVLWEVRVQGRIARSASAAIPPSPTPTRFRRAFGHDADLRAVDTLFHEAWTGKLATHRALLEAASRSTRPTVDTTERVRKDPPGPCIQVT